MGGRDDRPGEERRDGPPPGARGAPSGAMPPGEIGDLFAAGRRVMLRPGAVVVSEGTIPAASSS